jgi:hypothetical protein
MSWYKAITPQPRGHNPGNNANTNSDLVVYFKILQMIFILGASKQRVFKTVQLRNDKVWGYGI